MRRIAILSAALLLGACHFHFDNPHLEPRGLTEEDLLAPPNKSEVRGAITYSARVVQEFRLKLDEGAASPPPSVAFDDLGINLKRVKDGKLLWKVTLWDDSPERHAAVTETAYWDEESSSYIFQYRGGDPYRSVWFGPITLNLKRAGVPEHDAH